MKKYIVLAVIALTIFSGCGKKIDNTPVDSDKNSSVPQENDTEDEAPNEETTVSHSVDSYIDSAYSQKGTMELPFEETDSYTLEYDYNIPKILDDSADADRINRELYELAKPSIDQVEAAAAGSSEEIFEPEYIEIGYNAFLNDDILSVVLRADSAYSDWRTYVVYNYNVNTKSEVSNDELLSFCDIKDEDFISMAKDTFGDLALTDLDEFLYNKDESDEDVEDESALYADYADSNEWKYRMLADYIADYTDTVSDRNISKDMSLYLNKDGRLCAINLVYVPAGAGQYYYDAVLENKSNSEMIEKYNSYVREFHYDGFEKSCLRLYGDEGFNAAINHKSSSLGDYEEEVYIGFDSNDESKFTMQFYSDDISDVYIGTLNFKGFDEKGIIFGYEFTEKNGQALTDKENIISGSFYLNSYMYYDAAIKDMVYGAAYKYIDGVDMLDSKGETIELIKSFG